MPALPSPTFEQVSQAGEFIKTASPLSHDAGVLIAGQNLAAGAVLGRITASGKLTLLAPAASDGSQIAVGLLPRPGDATTGDLGATFIARAAEVNESLCTWPAGITGPQRVSARSQLAALNIACR